MADHFDFDAFWAEQAAEAKTITAFGKTWPIPARLPAKVSLIAVRLEAERGKDGDVAVDEMISCAKALFGADAVGHFLDNGMSFEQLGDLFKHAMGMYRAEAEDDAEDDDEGEASAPTGA